MHPILRSYVIFNDNIYQNIDTVDQTDLMTEGRYKTVIGINLEYLKSFKSKVQGRNYLVPTTMLQ